MIPLILLLACCMGLSLYPYFGYPLLLLLSRAFVRRQASTPDDKYLPFVSIVLAAYNEAEHIERKLENCLSLDYPANRIEILVGSDGSDDGTNERVLQMDDPRIRFFPFTPRRGKMAAVNRLVREARGEICVFSDISEIFDADAVRRLVRHYADPSIGAVTGNHIYHRKTTPIGQGTSFYWRFQRFLQERESCLYTVCQCDGTIYSCRRELFPFPPDGTINDDVAAPLGILRQGKRIIFERSAIARGEVLKETRRFFRQKVRSQAGKYQVFAMFPRMFVPWPFIRWWIFISHCVMPVLVPWFLVGALAANLAMLAYGDTWPRVFLGLQFAFYGIAGIGYLGERLQIRLPGANLPFYFVAANLGSLCGFFAYLTGAQGPAWRKVE